MPADLHQHNAMATDFGLKLTGELAKVFLTPEVTDGLFATQTEVIPIYRDGRFTGTAIEQPDRLGTVFQILGPYFKHSALADACRLASERVLIAERLERLKKYCSHAERGFLSVGFGRFIIYTIIFGFCVMNRFEKTAWFVALPAGMLFKFLWE